MILTVGTFLLSVILFSDLSYSKAVSNSSEHAVQLNVSRSNSPAHHVSKSPLTPSNVMDERTLSGENDIIGLDRILFPPSFSSLSQPLRNVVNTIIRLPVMIAGLMVGEGSELLGLQTMQVGNAMLLAGAQKIGYLLKDYAIGFIAFGRTVKEWFVYNNIPALNDTGERPTVGYYWNRIGESYLQTRLEIEMLYGAHY